MASRDSQTGDSLVVSFLFGLIGFPSGLATLFLMSIVLGHLGHDSISFGFSVRLLAFSVPAFLLFCLAPLASWRDPLAVLVGGSLTSCLGFGIASVSTFALIKVWTEGSHDPFLFATLSVALAGSYVTCVWAGSRVYKALRRAP